MNDQVVNLITRVALLETALERIAGIESVGADVRAHCETALRRSKALGEEAGQPPTSPRS